MRRYQWRSSYPYWTRRKRSQNGTYLSVLRIEAPARFLNRFIGYTRVRHHIFGQSHGIAKLSNAAEGRNYNHDLRWRFTGCNLNDEIYCDLHRDTVKECIGTRRRCVHSAKIVTDPCKVSTAKRSKEAKMVGQELNRNGMR
jgi:hypothetical protein